MVDDSIYPQSLAHSNFERFQVTFLTVFLFHCAIYFSFSCRLFYFFFFKFSAASGSDFDDFSFDVTGSNLVLAVVNMQHDVSVLSVVELSAFSLFCSCSSFSPPLF